MTHGVCAASTLTALPRVALAELGIDVDGADRILEGVVPVALLEVGRGAV